MISKPLALALDAFVGSTVKFGTGADPRRALSKRLREISRANALYFNVATGMLVLSFVVALILVSLHAGDKQATEITLGGFGTSVAGMVWMMLRFWREKTRTEMLMTLIELEPTILRDVAVRFLDSIAPPQVAAARAPAGSPLPPSD
jgi:hypothetical protein